MGWSGDVVPPSQRPRLVARLELLQMQMATIRSTADDSVLKEEEEDASAQAEAARDEGMAEGEGVQNIE
jgi:hypothetical protein